MCSVKFFIFSLLKIISKELGRVFPEIEKQLALAEKVIKEEATCCGKCGREHVKDNCKRPYLKGAKHCRTK